MVSSQTGLTREQEVEVVDDIRFLIVELGGMATMTIVEKILMTRFNLEKHQARDMTNAAQYANKRCFRVWPLRWKAHRPQPKIEDWPEIADFQPEYRYKTNYRSLFQLRRRFHEIVLSYQTHTILPEDAVLIARTYSFLVPMNKVFSAAMLAAAMRQYSDHEQTVYLATLLEKIAKGVR